MSADTCMFCGQAPCECDGKKKRAAPAAQKKKAGQGRAAPKPLARPVAAPAPQSKKKLAAPPVSARKKVSAPAGGTRRAGNTNDDEFWEAVTTLVTQDMLHPDEYRRILSAYPRRPQ